MIPILPLVVASTFAYVAVGVLSLVIYERAIDGGVDETDKALMIVTNWPIIVFIVWVARSTVTETVDEAECPEGETHD